MSLGFSIAFPPYLEEALAPFEWSGIFSESFKRSIGTAIISSNRQESIESLVASITTIRFLDKDFQQILCDALLRFAKEGFPS